MGARYSDVTGFEWNKDKAHANFLKHGVRFKRAVEAMEDPWGITQFDAMHSQEEERFTRFGFDRLGRLIRVSYCYRGCGSIVRIISARFANARELKRYLKGGF